MWSGTINVWCLTSRASIWKLMGGDRYTTKTYIKPRVNRGSVWRFVSGNMIIGWRKKDWRRWAFTRINKNQYGFIRPQVERGNSDVELSRRLISLWQQGVRRSSQWLHFIFLYTQLVMGLVQAYWIMKSWGMNRQNGQLNGKIKPPIVRRGLTLLFDLRN